MTRLMRPPVLALLLAMCMVAPACCCACDEPQAALLREDLPPSPHGPDEGRARRGLRDTEDATPVTGEQPRHTGMVLAGNARANLVVISIGSADGVRVGFRYLVSRGDRYVTTIQIKDVMPKQSAAYPLRELEKSFPRKGDRVSSK